MVKVEEPLTTASVSLGRRFTLLSWVTIALKEVLLLELSSLYSSTTSLLSALAF